MRDSVSFKTDERVHFDVHRRDAMSTAEFGQIDDEAGGDNHPAGAADELDGCSRRPASGDEVVNEKDARALCNRVGVNLNDTDAVLQAVFLPDRARRQLALLADGNEAAAERIGDGATQDKTASFDDGYAIDARVGERSRQPVDGGAQTGRIGDQGRNIAEKNAGFRIVGDRPDQRLDVDPGHGFPGILRALGGAPPSPIPLIANARGLRHTAGPTATLSRPRDGRLDKPALLNRRSVTLSFILAIEAVCG